MSWLFKILAVVSTCLMQHCYRELEENNTSLLKTHLSLLYAASNTDVLAFPQGKAVLISLDLSDIWKVKNKKRMEFFQEGENVPLFKPFLICLWKEQGQHRLTLHILLPFLLSASPYISANVRKEPQVKAEVSGWRVTKSGSPAVCLTLSLEKLTLQLILGLKYLRMFKIME